MSLLVPGSRQAQTASRGSGEVLDRVADLHTAPIKGPAQTQNSQQNDKCPGCVDASILLCRLPCAKLTDEEEKKKMKLFYCFKVLETVMQSKLLSLYLKHFNNPQDLSKIRWFSTSFP